MKMAQMGKRIFLFMAVNLLVVTTISIVLALFGAGQYFPHGGIAQLAVICLVWGFAGALISLALSRVMAKWMMGVQIIPPDTRHPDLRALVQTVHGMAQHARLPAMPEVGIYESQEVNAFATGPTKSRSLVAVSTGLLQRMRSREVAGVLGHEIAHIANGDMVTMTLIQGVINAFVLFLSRVLAFVISQALRSRDDRGGGSWILQYALMIIFQIVFSILGMIVVNWFSRWREFRADAGGARFAGRENMIDALRALQRVHDPELAAVEAKRAQGFQSLKISGQTSAWARLFATHPPLEERIARLQQARD